MPHVLFHSQHPAGHETPISLQLAYSTYFVLCASVWENKERQKILSVCVRARACSYFPSPSPVSDIAQGTKPHCYSRASEWAITLKHPR